MHGEVKSRIEKALKEDKKEKIRKAKVYGKLKFNREVCDIKCRGVDGIIIYEGLVQPKTAIVRKKCWDIYKALIREGKSSQEAEKLILDMSIDEILKG
jgi:hypothetical protein